MRDYEGRACIDRGVLITTRCIKYINTANADFNISVKYNEQHEAAIIESDLFSFCRAEFIDGEVLQVLAHMHNNELIIKIKGIYVEDDDLEYWGC
jgi:hypothetical protein